MKRRRGREGGAEADVARCGEHCLRMCEARGKEDSEEEAVRLSDGGEGEVDPS